jgi:hypothetical protein
MGQVESHTVDYLSYEILSGVDQERACGELRRRLMALLDKRESYHHLVVPKEDLTVLLMLKGETTIYKTEPPFEDCLRCLTMRGFIVNKHEKELLITFIDTQ